MATDPVSNPINSPATSSTLNNAVLGNLKLDDFLKMLLAELQNQDPLSPMDSSQMLTQIGQISQVGATQNLTDTLDSVLLGQNINNATALIGKTIAGLDDNGQSVVGKVDRVIIADNKPVLTVGNSVVQLTNVQAVLPDPGDTTSTASAAAAGAAGTSTDQLQQLLKLLQQSQTTAATTTTPTTTTVQPTTATTS